MEESSSTFVISEIHPLTLRLWLQVNLVIVLVHILNPTCVLLRIVNIEMEALHFKSMIRSKVKDFLSDFS